ncbi:hypothetical protein ACWT_4701 [Actinoplanes sp. SE50]|uniref:hypothetical protein n=1 Tax=unclassified Actinoplanes TaxID=2626549 RepID=UPI00023EBD89|nr:MULTISPECIES: hypothetical protein [unclassified Actinoplanes]AEV85723.1 hypothetical protein ACPL_4832 [Actinoplanes sp. SE50/110]ATO84116.1 hypothetical protein ACWT_4701 [Actinoplanes sp. SE50]SLM01526.1 hypothetical protein ACSP50_4762 [Actinoplanes sp. SE50/110]
MNASGPAARQAELRLRVAEHLEPGETLHAALWIARDPGLPLISRLAPGMPGSPPPGPAGGIAAELYRHLPEHTVAATLALTGDRLRLLLLDGEFRPPRRRLFGRSEPAPLPPLAPVWECPRAGLATAAADEPAGSLTLRFADGSALAVAAPGFTAVAFAEAAGRSGAGG